MSADEIRGESLLAIPPPAGRVRGLPRLARAARVIHPFPTLANVLATGLFALIAAHGRPPAGRTALLLATMFCIQCAIGATNDARDVELDRASKPWKPIVAGALGRGSAWVIAGTAAIAACLLATRFGPAGWALALAGLACGLAYDLGLKRSRFSVVTYLIALPLLPLWVWVALDRFSAGLLWEYPLGALIGVSLYLGNTAPDIAADAAAGVAGAAHRLGLRRTLLGAWGALALAIGAGLGLAPVAGYELRLVAAGGGVGLLCLAAAVALSLRGGGREALLRAWALLIAGGLAFGLGWLAAAP